MLIEKDIASKIVTFSITKQFLAEWDGYKIKSSLKFDWLTQTMVKQWFVWVRSTIDIGQFQVIEEILFIYVVRSENFITFEGEIFEKKCKKEFCISKTLKSL